MSCSPNVRLGRLQVWAAELVAHGADARLDGDLTGIAEAENQRRWVGAGRVRMLVIPYSPTPRLAACSITQFSSAPFG